MKSKIVENLFLFLVYEYVLCTYFVCTDQEKIVGLAFLRHISSVTL